MRARCLAAFWDMAERVQRSPGDEWGLDAARLGEINAAGYGPLAEAARGRKAPKAPRASPGEAPEGPGGGDGE